MQFIKRQVEEVQQGGRTVLLRKMKFSITKIPKIPLLILAILPVLIIRLIKPWLLVRLEGMISSRIGHFAGNIELYLCERDAGINVPNQRYVDIFYMAYSPICNKQLATMWQRVLHILPTWIMSPIDRINRLIPGGKLHEVGQNTMNDRDVHNLLDKFPSHLQFTPDEEARGEAGLLAMGIPVDAQFVCLIVRDSAYLDSHIAYDWSYQNFRDCDIQSYVFAAETLAERGYFVIRMGAKVHAPINSTHPKVIDYATNGMRSDFMDIYLGAKCAFCISTGTGWDTIPAWLFRKPAVFVDQVSLGYLQSFSKQFILLGKRHYRCSGRQELSLSEIFSQGVGFSQVASFYESKGVAMMGNTPEEIRDVAIEMVERLAGTWQADKDDEVLQQRFWEIFPIDAVEASTGELVHGEIRSRYGASFLRNNPEWLQ